MQTESWSNYTKMYLSTKYKCEQDRAGRGDGAHIREMGEEKEEGRKQSVVVVVALVLWRGR